MKSKNNLLMFKLATLLATLTAHNPTEIWAQDLVTPKKTPAPQSSASNQSKKSKKRAPVKEVNPALYGEGGHEDNTSDMTPYENETAE